MVPERGNSPTHTSGKGPISRWVCDCQDPPVLLATFDGQGTVNIKARDRYWTVKGEVWARCPLCGTEHYYGPAGADVEAIGA
jgi:hypothetical protein